MHVDFTKAVIETVSYDLTVLSYVIDSDCKCSYVMDTTSISHATHFNHTQLKTGKLTC